jgi:phosphotransferase system HPr (HPr) family protein
MRFAAEVRVRCDGAEADGKSVMELLCLAAGFGMALELEARGLDAEEAVITLADLISARSHEIQGCRVS